MNAKKKSLLLLLALVVILGGAAAAYSFLSDGAGGQVAAESSGEEQTQTVTAPDFTVYDADGNEVTLSFPAGKTRCAEFLGQHLPALPGGDAPLPGSL